jgi:CrcB protein
MQLIFIAIGGAIGAVLRFLVSGWIYGITTVEFATGTLFVNVLGSFFLGFLGTLFSEKLIISPNIKGFITIGILGAFTTFSTFTFESMKFFQNREYMYFFLNIVGSLILGLIAVWLGIILAEKI